MLGTIALSGIIMRNSVILVDQIEQDIAAGRAPWDAIVGATVRRFRPIVLTAAAAVLAMIPLVRSDFFGPMAVAMMGGIVVATVLTLGLPAGAVRGVVPRAAATPARRRRDRAAPIGRRRAVRAQAPRGTMRLRAPGRRFVARTS